jgi:O-antigen/teichoic acid export membrane protein
LGYSGLIGLTVATLVYSVLAGYNSTLSGIQNAARQRGIVAFHGGLDAWLKIALAIGIILWLGASSTAVVIGFGCSSLLITFSQLVFLRRTILQKAKKTSEHKWWMQKMWAFSWPFSAWGVFTWMQQISDRWALQAFASTTDVGQYSVVFQLGYSPIALVTGMAVSFLAPILYKRSGDGTDYSRNTNVHHFCWRLTYISFFITLIGFVITLIMHKWLFQLFVASEYRGISNLLPWVVLAGGFFATGQVLALKLMSEMKTIAMATVKIVTALLGLLMNIIGAVLAGMKGVVIALVIFSSIYLVWLVLLAGMQSLKTEEIY